MMLVQEGETLSAVTSPDLTQHDRIKSTPRLFEDLQ
jgi:hypothetical protein